MVNTPHFLNHKPFFQQTFSNTNLTGYLQIEKLLQELDVVGGITNSRQARDDIVDTAFLMFLLQ